MRLVVWTVGVLSVLAVAVWWWQRPPPRPAPSSLTDERQRYIEATISLVCLGREEPDPRHLAVRAWEIYQEYGFSPPMTYLPLVERYETDPTVKAAIDEGTSSCR